MVDERNESPPASDHLSLVERLAKEADISEERARELIGILGADSSLVREARFLSRSGSKYE